MSKKNKKTNVSRINPLWDEITELVQKRSNDKKDQPNDIDFSAANGTDVKSVIGKTKKESKEKEVEDETVSNKEKHPIISMKQNIVLEDINETQNQHSLYYILASTYALRAKLFNKVVLNYGMTDDVDEIINNLDEIESAINVKYKNLVNKSITRYDGSIIIDARGYESAAIRMITKSIAEFTGIYAGEIKHFNDILSAYKSRYIFLKKDALKYKNEADAPDANPEYDELIDSINEMIENDRYYSINVFDIIEMDFFNEPQIKIEVDDDEDEDDNEDEED